MYDHTRFQKRQADPKWDGRLSGSTKRNRGRRWITTNSTIRRTDGRQTKPNETKYGTHPEKGIHTVKEFYSTPPRKGIRPHNNAAAQNEKCCRTQRYLSSHRKQYLPTTNVSTRQKGIRVYKKMNPPKPLGASNPTPPGWFLLAVPSETPAPTPLRTQDTYIYVEEGLSPHVKGDGSIFGFFLSTEALAASFLHSGSAQHKNAHVNERQQSTRGKQRQIIPNDNKKTQTKLCQSVSQSSQLRQTNQSIQSSQSRQ